MEGKRKGERGEERQTLSITEMQRTSRICIHHMHGQWAPQNIHTSQFTFYSIAFIFFVPTYRRRDMNQIKAAT
jgi:hypothetical protein